MNAPVIAASLLAADFAQFGREAKRKSAAALFAAVADGVKAKVRERFPLKDAVAAHRATEARETTGATVLISERV